MIDLRDRNDDGCSSDRDCGIISVTSESSGKGGISVSLEAAGGLEAAGEGPKSIGLLSSAVSSAFAFTPAAALGSFMKMTGLTVQLALAPLVAI